VLYVDALNAPNAKPNTEGIAAAYHRVADLETFDYRRAGESPASMNARLLEAALAFEPDLVHLGKCERVKGGTVRAVKEALPRCVVVHFYGDYRREPQEFAVEIGRYADWTLLQHDDKRQHKQYLDRGVRRVGCWRIGTNPAVYQPYKYNSVYDVVFMANNADFLPGHEDRRVLISALAASGVYVHLFGHKWDGFAKRPGVTIHGYVSGKQFALACSRAKITLGCNAVHDVYLYASWPRPLNSMASGAFHLARYFAGLETVFRNRQHLVWFHSPEECVELVHYYLAHPDERRKIAEAGRREVLARHTWDHRIAWMLDYWERALEG
jgi:hypothetical protein